MLYLLTIDNFKYLLTIDNQGDKNANTNAWSSTNGKRRRGNKEIS